MPHDDAELIRRLARLERQVGRERAARAEAERLLESKGLELYEANQRLVALNADLENRVRVRTEEAERARQAAQIATERVNIATASGRIGIWNFDIATGVLVWDDLMRELYGIPPDEVVVPDIWSRRLHPDDRARAEAAAARAIDEGAPYDIEFRIVWPDASIRHIRAAGRVTRDETGRPLQMIGVNWDVTEARQLAADLRQQMALQAESAEREIAARAELDAAERAARAKTEFLATMSHEIRSPLSGLLGVLDVLRASNLEPEHRRMADMAHNSASILLAVLNDVLDFSKIEAGALSIEAQPMQLRQTLDDLVQPHLLAAKHKGLALTLSVDPAVPEWLLTDSLRLQQIVGNLLSNARKFTSAGEIAVDVTVPRDAPAPTLRIDVRDTGIGIDAAALGRLFRPFSQADSSTSRVYGGTGLGLAISQKLADLLQGSLSVSSELGVGSVFSLHLPLVPCPARQDHVATADSAQTVLVPAGRRALVVDDEPTIRWLSERQLKSLGFEVEVAPDGAAALQRFRAGSFDLVLTDCHMPRMDGVALTEAIRAAEQVTFQRVPVIGLTADVTETQRERCLAAGMSDLAIKPLSLARLSALIARHFAVIATPPPAAAPAPAEAPALRAVAFDDSIYLSMFDPADAEGAAWLHTYLATARDDAAVLRDLVAAGADRLPELVALSHRLAGACFSVGAMLAGAAARALETAAKSGDVAALPALLADLAARLATAEATITGFLAPPEADVAGPAARLPAMQP